MTKSPNAVFNRYKRRIEVANPKAKFWDTQVRWNGRRSCLIVHGEHEVGMLHPSSYSFCKENEVDYKIDGDIVVYPEVAPSVENDLKARDCPVLEVHEHLGRHHLHFFCVGDVKKANRLVDYLRWF